MFWYRRGYILNLLAILCAAFAGCSEPEPPSRDHMQAIRRALYKLQIAVLDQNRAALDSLLSVKLLDAHQSGDSLLAVVYGASNTESFSEFGRYDIMYTHDKARVDCYIIDSATARSVPITLNFHRADTLWLLSSFSLTSGQ